LIELTARSDRTRVLERSELCQELVEAVLALAQFSVGSLADVIIQNLPAVQQISGTAEIMMLPERAVPAARMLPYCSE
jgi:hypothetical protein